MTPAVTVRHAPTAHSVAGRWRPSREQELLLSAALLQDERAFDAFARWRALVEAQGVERLDPASVRLLPLLLHNLHRLGHAGPIDPLFELMRTERTRAFFDYHLLLRRCRPVFTAFDSAAIPHLVLKGAALAARYYSESASRPMEDLDLLVPIEQAPGAVAVLRQLGWTPVRPLDDLARELRLLHSVGFAEAQGRGALDLHWRPLYDGFDAEGDRRMWARSVPVVLDGVDTRMFDPTDQLLHACVHGMRWNGMTAPIRWVADVEVVLRSADIDWPRLAEDAEARGVLASVHVLLRYIDGRFGTTLPPASSALFETRPAHLYGRFANWARTARPSTASTAAHVLVVTFADRTRGMTATQRVRAYPAYLRAWFAQESLWGVVRRVVTAPTRRRGARRRSGPERKSRRGPRLYRSGHGAHPVRGAVDVGVLQEHVPAGIAEGAVGRRGRRGLP